MTTWPEILPASSYGPILIILGILTFIYEWRKGSYKSLRADRWVRMWDLVKRDPLPFRRVLPLGEASQIVYEKCRKTPYGKISEKYDHNDPVGVYPYHFTSLDGAQIFGTKPPSYSIEFIPMREFASGLFSVKDNSFTRAHEGKARFENLLIRKVDVRRLVKKLSAVKP